MHDLMQYIKRRNILTAVQLGLLSREEAIFWFKQTFAISFNRNLVDHWAEGQCGRACFYPKKEGTLIVCRTCSFPHKSEED